MPSICRVSCSYLIHDGGLGGFAAIGDRDGLEAFRARVAPAVLLMMEIFRRSE